MMLPTGARKLAFLRAASTHRGSRHIKVIETHFAWVILTRHHAYKLRKPLRHGRMDYRTLAQRRRGCRLELLLNRRLAPSTYLGVVPLRMSRAGQLQMHGRAAIVDYLVKMRRLPATWMLDSVLSRRSLRAGEISRLLRLLGGFFGRARHRPLERSEYLGRVRRQMAVNRGFLLARAANCSSLVRRIDAMQRRVRAGLHSELAGRGAELVDGHGDLRPEHVCLRPCVVIDCIEFDPDLRRMDPLEEMAFLALEIERMGHAALAWGLLGRYRHRHAPSASDALVHFYMCHRALTRARISAWHIGDPQFPDPRPWRARTLSYLRDAARHVARALQLLNPVDQPVARRSRQA